MSGWGQASEAKKPADAGGSSGAGSTSSVAVRPEVKEAVQQVVSAPKAKAKSSGAPSSAPGGVAKEKVKPERPAPTTGPGGRPIQVVPAQVPSPSMAGVTEPPQMGAGAGTTTVASAGASATYRTSPAPMAGASQVAPPAQRTPAGNISGGYGQGVPSIPAAKGGVPIPARAVEIVSRMPEQARIGAPPQMTPISGQVPATGYASSLTAMAQGAAKAQGMAVPKGPASVAVGRALVRGTRPAVIKNAAGKLATPISKKYQVVFVTSEVAPWSKTGGLGEAMDGLPIALAALGHRVMTISPRYDQYMEAWDTGYWSSVDMGDNEESVHAFHAHQQKVDRVFLDHDCFLAKVSAKTGSMLYGPEWGKDFADNQWRFIYFAKAVLKIIQELPLGGFTYGSNCIVVTNDWHSALVPVYIKLERDAMPEKWAGTKTALLIHNAVFQGRFDRNDPEEPAPEVYGLPESAMKEFTYEMPLKVGRTEPKIKQCINWMAAAAINVDRTLTVSPTYAWELVNMPEMGVELEEIFQRRGITGIINGVKEAVSPLNPDFVTKSRMLSTFGTTDVDEKKAELKVSLQELYDLPVSKSTPLHIFVGRMDLQKGYDYILAALTAVLPKVEMQIIIIGTGRADLVASTKALAQKYPDKVYLAGWCGPERYAIVAGADFNLMPSRWEPCGLAQMESMRFGTLPLVAETGGLIDTVEDGVSGIHLKGAVSVEKELDPISVELVANGIERCCTVYKNAAEMTKMRKSAMAAGSEYTWSNSALQYEAVFEELGAVDVMPLCPTDTVTLETDKAVA